MLETSTESSLTDTVTQLSLDVPVTTTSIVQNYQTLAVTELQPHQLSTTDCCNNDIPQQSLAAVYSHQLPTASSSLSSRGKVSRGRASSNRCSTQMRRGRQKTSSDAGRTATVCRVILPAAVAVTSDSHHGSIATTSTVDAKARLRAMLLSISTIIVSVYTSIALSS